MVDSQAVAWEVEGIKPPGSPNKSKLPIQERLESGGCPRTPSSEAKASQLARAEENRKVRKCKLYLSSCGWDPEL